MYEYAAAHLTCEYEGDYIKLQLAPESPSIPNALNYETMRKSLGWLINQYLIFEDIKNFCDQIKDSKYLYGSWFLLYT